MIVDRAPHHLHAQFNRAKIQMSRRRVFAFLTRKIVAIASANRVFRFEPTTRFFIAIAEKERELCREIN